MYVSEPGLYFLSGILFLIAMIGCSKYNNPFSFVFAIAFLWCIFHVLGIDILHSEFIQRFLRP
jgi:hypothetical protein